MQCKCDLRLLGILSSNIQQETAEAHNFLTRQISINETWAGPESASFKQESFWESFPGSFAMPAPGHLPQQPDA